MFFVKRLNLFAALSGIITFTVLIIINPDICKAGAISGILMCGRIIIPSLFPFTMCVLFIMKSGVLQKLKPLTPITKAIFGITADKFSLLILSMIGGYPVGARLIKECADNGEITEKQGRMMLNYCINAGPAFIIGAVGGGIMGSKEVGYLLLASHITASLFLCFISRFFKTEDKISEKNSPIHISVADNFVISASEAAASVLGICAFVILFSAINAYIKAFSIKLPLLKSLLLLTEVTNAVTYTNNIILISFLLGLGGFCVWCQVISAAKGIKINFFLFFLFRLLHGILSAVFTKLGLNIFGISLPTFSSGNNFSFQALYSTPALTVSMLAMGIIFAISVTSKKYNGKILEDII